MSDLGAEDDRQPTDPLRAVDALDTRVGKILARVHDLEERLGDSERRRQELQRLLERFESGGEDPATVARHARRLEEENRALRRRLEEGRGAVERVLARIRFLEENP